MTLTVPPQPTERWNLWKHGVTQSFLNSFMSCRWTTLLKYTFGYSSRSLSFPLEFGNAAHYVCEKAYLKSSPPSASQISKWIQEWVEHSQEWGTGTEYQTVRNQEMRELWMAQVEIVMRKYFQVWKKDFSMDWIFTEWEFNHPYVYQQDRKVVPMRGKMDGLFRNKHGEEWLFDTKTKASWHADDVMDGLLVDLQMMLYMWILWQQRGTVPAGCRYNVIKRPQLRQGKAESSDKFLQRIEADVEKNPSKYFERFDMAVTKHDIDMWKIHHLDLLMFDVRDCVEHRRWYVNPQTLTWGGRKSDFFYAITKSDFSGLYIRDRMFPELGDFDGNRSEDVRKPTTKKKRKLVAPGHGGKQRSKSS